MAMNNTTLDKTSIVDYSDIEDAHQIRITFYFVCLGIIIPVGLFFNLLAFVVLVRTPSLRIATTGSYLIALSIADSIYLIGELLVWLNLSDTKGQILGLEFTEEIGFWCRLQHFLRYYGRFTSIWLTVAITTERYCVAAFPMHIKQISTKAIAMSSICGVYVVGAGLTSFAFWTLHVVYVDAYQYWYCSYHGYYHKWNWVVNKIGSIILPCVLVLIFTIGIVIELKRMSQKRIQLTGGATGIHNKDVSNEKQLSRMLLTVAIATLILRLPYTIMFIPLDKRYDIWGDDIRNTWFEFNLHLFKDICFIIAVTNFAINFFLYYFTGKTFRKNLWKCLKCQEPKSPSRKRGLVTRTTMATTLQSNSRSNSNASVHRINNEGSNIPLQTKASARML